MTKRPRALTCVALFACLLATRSFAEDLLQPGDRILAIGRGLASNSGYPDNESPPNAIDVDENTKYLNFAGANSGFIITLEGGPAPARSIEVRTANDAPGRDPTSFVLYGSNDPIVSTDNSPGNAESWTEIGSGALELPDDPRLYWGPPVDIANDTAYASYKLLFPTLKGDPLMQVSEVEFYDQAGGYFGGGNLLMTPTASILAIHAFNSSYPEGESPEQAIDGISGTKYLNLAEVETGLIVVPSVGLTRVDSFVITTAGDAEERDPASYELYGTVDAVVSQDNSDGEAESWTLIASGPLTLPPERETAADPVTVASSADYTAYKMIFPTVKDSATANSMQIADVQLDGLVFSPPEGDPLTLQGDRIVAIDTDVGSRSSYPEAEEPRLAMDGNEFTKYLNFGGTKTGFIVTPLSGAAAVQSFQIFTANDAPDRDPSAWAIYGTNEAIASADNSTGEGEAWTLIMTGTVALPDDRSAAGPVVEVANTTAFTSYKMIFTELKGDAPSMQISEVEFYDAPSGGGNALLSVSDAVLAVQAPVALSGFGGGESPARAVDGSLNSKYLNNGGENSGFVLMPTAPSTVVKQFIITTGNDAENRDPAAYELYGSLDPLMSIDNSTGDAESWTLIASGELSLTSARSTPSNPVDVPSTVAYRTYKMVFPAIKDSSTDNQMQISEIQFRGEIVDPGPARLLAPGDAILAVNSRLEVQSSYPDAEPPINAIDGTPEAKYLNFGGRDTGFIVTPAAPAVVRGFMITTANDAAGRDPDEWALYGTDDAITSPDNSGGDGEDWTLIETGTVVLPDDRLAAGPVVAVANEIAYASFRLIFTGLKDDNDIMQIGEVQFFDDALGAGNPILGPGNAILAVGTLKSPSRYPGAEGPGNILDGLVGTKYYNTSSGNDSGFIVTPTGGSSIATGLELRTANDATQRDPLTYEVYGTVDPIASPDNSTGTDEAWTLIVSGSMELPLARYQIGSVVNWANTEAFTSYKVLFPTVRGDGNGMQISEAQLLGTSVQPATFEILDVSIATDAVTLQWESESGLSYEIYYTADLNDWSQKLAAPVSGSAGNTEHTFANPMPGAETLTFRIETP